MQVTLFALGVAIPTLMCLCIAAGIAKRLLRRHARPLMGTLSVDEEEEFDPWVLNSQLPAKKLKPSSAGVKTVDIEMVQTRGAA